MLQAYVGHRQIGVDDLSGDVVAAFCSLDQGDAEPVCAQTGDGMDRELACLNPATNRSGMHAPPNGELLSGKSRWLCHGDYHGLVVLASST